MSDYCRYCEQDAIKDRIKELQGEKILGEEMNEYEDIREWLEDEGEIGLCYECTREEDADMDRDEY